MYSVLALSRKFRLIVAIHTSSTPPLLPSFYLLFLNDPWDLGEGGKTEVHLGLSCSFLFSSSWPFVSLSGNQHLLQNASLVSDDRCMDMWV